MNTIEEKIWNYIDGISSAEERNEIEQLMQRDPAIKKLHEDFLLLSNQLKGMEPDEPSLRFTQNVMDVVSKEPIPAALKTKVDKRIINGIGGFFLILIGGMLAYSLSQVNWGGTFSLPVNFSIPKINLSSYFDSRFVMAFLTIDVVLGLLLLDRVMRRRRHAEEM